MMDSPKKLTLNLIWCPDSPNASNITISLDAVISTTIMPKLPTTYKSIAFSEAKEMDAIFVQLTSKDFGASTAALHFRIGS